MARKVLQKLTQAQAAKEAGAKQPQAAPTSLGGLREGLERITNNAIRELDPSAIDQDGLRDRLEIDDADIAELAESIREHGQQVPVLVRPAAQPGRYRIIYGRRRLAAIRKIGGTVKAIVRSLDDRASVIAQGQENNLRLDPSFIEKAVFIGAMRDEGYDGAVIRDALGISKQSVSSYVVVLDAVPLPVIEAIGPAHDTGRRRWTELADLARKDGIDLVGVLTDCQSDIAAAADSAARFDVVLQAAKQGKARSRPPALSQPSETTRRPVAAEDGERIAELRRARDALQISVSLKETPEFGTWLEDHADDLLRELHTRWQESKRSKG